MASPLPIADPSNEQRPSGNTNGLEAVEHGVHPALIFEARPAPVIEVLELADVGAGLEGLAAGAAQRPSCG